MASGSPADDRQARAGWPAANVYRLRLAQAADVVAVADMFETAWQSDSLGTDEARATQRGDQPGRASALAVHLLETGDVGGLLAKQRDGTPGSLFADLTAAALSESLSSVLAGMSLVIVAVDPQQRVVGALVAGPPVDLMQAVIHAGGDRYQAMAVAATISRIEGLAVVDSARRSGVGAALLRRTVKLYYRAGYLLVYGPVPSSIGMRRCYQRAEFELLLDGRLDLKSLLGLDAAIIADPGEGLAVRWRR
jgi:GNAT superfamily N-acetyltransferase